MTEGKVKTTIYWPETLRAHLEQLAKKDGRSLNAYVTRVLMHHVIKEWYSGTVYEVYGILPDKPTERSMQEEK